ncbi:TRAP transporter small permease [Phaeovulum vinaykumarii]|uniref:TRAP transporter small permease protein n=1 Tax=Phaeovulum vinaykumarii TaxID=407234 RepID=A0A1N7KAI0_9RHOB|nr:TRAP transporter small permease [Phaeovulum vinaykumarii]SIS58510.1 Tripartite ATP-independent transporter, DctQ component [Phaeovulum vinaykumarii]SOB93822.1 tripartite ATP-independent transporter DctQ subunit [Phaeovulum vinaykumarii]
MHDARRSAARLGARLAQGLALAGGAGLLAGVGLVCLSVAGNAVAKIGLSPWLAATAPDWAAAIRGSGIGPIRATYEVIELGAGFVIFAFLPWAQASAGHARVEALTHWLPARALAALDRLWDIAMTLALAMIAWRLGAGMLAQMDSGETTFLLRIPVWWGYALALAGAWGAALVAALSALAPREEPA